MENTVYIVRVAECEWDVFVNHSAYVDRNRAEEAAAELRSLVVYPRTEETEGYGFRYASVIVSPIPLL